MALGRRPALGRDRRDRGRLRGRETAVNEFKVSKHIDEAFDLEFRRSLESVTLKS